ncbi:MAG: DUF6144 family protein [bacterium]
MIKQEEAFKERCKARGLDEAQTEEALAFIGEFEKAYASAGMDMENITPEEMKEYVGDLLKQRKNEEGRILALARYSYLLKNEPVYLLFTQIFGSYGVLPSIAERAKQLAGEGIGEELFKGIEVPPLGSLPEAFPPVVQEMMARMASRLPSELCRKILAGNHHGIPASAFDEERARYEKASSVDEYLKDRHARMVDELQQHCDENKLWYEQKITQRVVDFVKSNQELLSAVREGDTLYVTKIPYNPDKYLTESDPLIKRYLACHCPLAASTILKEGAVVPPTWCYCSAGYEKTLFDNVFGESLEVEVKQSVLDGSERCRFAISLGTLLSCQATFSHTLCQEAS